MISRRAVWSLGFLMLLSGAAKADPWINFDSPASGPNQPNYMWIDKTVFFKDNFFMLSGTGVSSATWTNLRSQNGAGSVVAGFHEDWFYRKPTANQNFWGGSDALFLSAGTLPGGGTFADWSGLVMYVYVETTPGQNGNPVYPLYGKFYTKVGPGFTWYNGALTPLVRDQWNKVFIDFSAAFDANGTGPQAIPNSLLSDVTTAKEIGLQIVGGDYDHGDTRVFVDSIQLARAGVFGDDQTPPATPASFSAFSAGTGNQVNLSWTVSSSTDVDHYNIYRAFAPGFTPSAANRIKSVPDGSSSYQDVSVVDGIASYYRVTAVDKSGNESAPTSEQSATSSGPAAFDLSYLGVPSKGMTYVAWSSGSYLSTDSQSSLDDLMSTGANFVALVVTQYMQTFDATTIAPGATTTATDAAVAKAIQDIHARGMKVLLKPHVDVLDGAWRGQIHPGDPGSWFVSYGNFINHYADIAQANGVEMLCVGTEFKTMTDNKFWGATIFPYDVSAAWVSVINTVRTHYSGPLTYAANTAHPQDEFAQIEFWGSLDYVGLNAWWKMTSLTNPTVDQIKTAWSLNREGFMPLQSAVDWRDYTGKPFIVTELGARSADGTNMDPPNFVGTPPVDLQEQDDMYNAAFAAWNHRSWVKGLFWWHWDPNPNGGGKYSNYYVPNDKPVLQTITQMYGGENTGNNFHYNFETSTQEWTADYSVFFKNNLTTPTANGAPHSGNFSLAYPLSFNDPASGDIGDFAYVEPRIRKDLSDYKGLKMYVRLPAGTITDEVNNPLKAVVVLQTGPTFQWFESNTARTLSSGQWRELSIDFKSAKRASDNALGVPVANLADIRRIGVSIFGAGATNGNTTLLVDDVVARATYTVLGLSLNTTSYVFPAAQPLQSVLASNSIDFENSGNTRVLFKMRVSNASPANWAPSTTAPGAGQFVMNAMFNSVQPSNFVEVNHALTTIDQSAGAAKFNGNELGSEIMPGDVRNLWFQFRAPSPQATDLNVQQQIPLSITAEVE